MERIRSLKKTWDKGRLIAASGLLIDYILTVSVSIAAGVDALISAFPLLATARIELGLVFLLVLIVGNLRGIRESGRAFSIPTLMFVGTIILLLAVGLTRYAFGLRAPATQPVPTNLLGSVSFFLVLRAFSSGCTALTGTEAISNGVLVFKQAGSGQCQEDNALYGYSPRSSLPGYYISCQDIQYYAHRQPNGIIPDCTHRIRHRPAVLPRTIHDIVYLDNSSKYQFR